MLALVVPVLLCVSASGEDSPRLWGSRVVGTPQGPSPTMSYEYPDGTITHVRRDFVWGELTFAHGVCFLNNTKIWGEPCTLASGYANITLNMATAQKVMVMFQGGHPTNVTATTFFVPRCRFTPPTIDEVDVNSSFPLSRFVKGQSSFNITFAVGAAHGIGTATLLLDGTPICNWTGINLTLNNSDSCAPMQRDEEANLRVFRGVFRGKSNVSRERFTFAGNSTVLVVSVDYSQSGTSPEVAECNQYQTVTDTSSSLTTKADGMKDLPANPSARSPPTGAAAPHTLSAIFVPAIMLLHWWMRLLELSRWTGDGTA
ncbi:hypothetical protein TcWFU_007607 [Taenia crassiceps]